MWHTPGECGGIDVVVVLMHCHSLHVRIQTQASLVPPNLEYQNDTNKQGIIRCGDPQVFIAALSQHKMVEHVQTWSFLCEKQGSESATA